MDSTELYKIKKIVQVKKDRINVINAIKVLSNNSSYNKDNSNPLPNIGNKGWNNFKDHTHNKEENDFNAIFFRYIYVHISLIYSIWILSRFKTNIFLV